ncbi:MAG: cation-transporting P-type ATPase [Gammaproteobacteria bacterium]|nr:cation-transporting P-type ATPase [Gammaproteobacteria bacterium]
MPGSVRVRVVHDALPGRVRLRVFGLKRCGPLGEHIEAHLGLLPGVLRVEASPLTGNVLVLCGNGLGAAALAAAVESVLPPPTPPRTPIARSAQAAAPAPWEGWSRWLRPASPPGPSVGMPSASSPSRPGPRESADDAPPWHSLSAVEAVARLGTSESRGLSGAEAAARLARHGPNALPRPERRSAAEMLLEQVATVPVGLLGVSAVVAVATGGLADAVVILGVVGINAAIGYFTEQQSERTIAALDNNAPAAATVVRDGVACRLPPEALVPGDLVPLQPGVRVPADARLVESSRLSVDESALTGESLPVDKSASLAVPAETPLADRRSMVYGGTVVTGGSGLAVIVVTGPRTQVGQIQTLAGLARPPETPMEQQLDRMGTQLALLSGAVCGLVMGIGVLRGLAWVQMLKSAISLAVAAVPEGLPTVATTTLALGIREMHRKKVLIRHLDAVEALGSVQVLCLDKTGTLTRNRMAVVTVRTASRDYAVCEERILADGVAVRPDESPELGDLLEAVVLCSTAEANGTASIPNADGTPTEAALLRLAMGAGVDVPALRSAHPIAETRFRSEARPFMVTVHTNPGGERRVAMKGSPSEVLARCSAVRLEGRTLPLTEALRERVVAANEAMAGDALRVLGVASGRVHRAEDADESGLVWLGLVGMTDPIRPGMGWLLGQFHRAGVRTVMITGDQTATAYAVARQLDLAGGMPLEILDSASLERIEPDLLSGMVRQVHVFARVSPAHKLRIVQALQQAGLVVAMTGDGINDGPALRAADIGVAMGGSGTDAARSVADVVLEDDNLHTMVIAVRQGRTTYNNIRKAVRFLLATNFSEIELMLLAVTLGLGQPLNAMQLLWVNLVSDIFPGLALALEPWEPGVMDRPPRDPGRPVLDRGDLLRLGRESAVITAGALASYLYALARYGAGPQAATQAFTTLTVGELLHALACRSEDHSLLDRASLQPNGWLELALAGSLLAQVLTVTLPPLRRLLGTTPLGPLDAVVAAVGAVLPLLFNESVKMATRTVPATGAGAPSGDADGGTAHEG